MKPHSVLLIAFVLFSSASIRAQDIILTKKGSEILVKVVKTGANVIEFSSYNHPKIKRIFSFPTSHALAIKYNDGTFATINGRPITTAAEYDYEKYTLISNRNKKYGIGLLSAGGSLLSVGAALIVTGVALGNNRNSDFSQSFFPLFVVTFCAAAGIPLTIIGGARLAKAKKYKAKANEVKPTMSFNPMLSPAFNPGTGSVNFTAGIGMGINF